MLKDNINPNLSKVCQLTNLPPGIAIDDDELQSYLRAVGIVMPAARVLGWQQHRRSSTLVFCCADVKRIAKLVHQTLYHNNRVVNVGKASAAICNELENKHGEEQAQDAAAAGWVVVGRLPPKKKTAAPSTNAGEGQQAAQPTKKSKKKRKKKNAANQAAGQTKNGNQGAHGDGVVSLATALHEYVRADTARAQKVYERHEVDELLRFLFPDTANQQVNRVYHYLLQQRKVKSARVGKSDRVVVVFKNRNGKFPSWSARRQQVRAEHEQLEANKHGIEVSKNNAALTVTLGETAQIVLKVTAPDVGPLTSTQLRNIDLNGRHGDHFKLFADVPMPVVASDSGGRPVEVQLAIKPRHPNVFRAEAHLHFVQDQDDGNVVTFTIVRFMVVKCTSDKKIADDLKPTAPFTPKKYQLYSSRKFKDVFNPPADRDKKGTNPLTNLPNYVIPHDVRRMLVDSELEDVLQPPTEQPLKGYSHFWQQLLWATEFQAQRDIQLYDMENVRLQRQGRLFVMEVPGLAESRPSVLRGDMVDVTWQERLYRGRVKFVRQLEVAMEFHNSFYQQYNPSLDRVMCRFTLSRSSFRTSHFGVVEAEKTMGEAMLMPRPSHVQDLERPSYAAPTIDQSNVSWKNRDLNPEQRDTVLGILRGRVEHLPYLVFGPPGTGKTTTVIEAIYQCAKRFPEARILVTAPSNDAVDYLAGLLAPSFPPSEMRRVLAYSRPIDLLPPSLRDYALGEASADDHKKEILRGRIVVSTVNLAARFSWFGVQRGYFDMLFVDEAGYATEPEVVAVAATLLDTESPDARLVLAGDPKQLGPYVTNDVCRKFKVNESYMERLMQREIYSKHDDGKFDAALVTKLVRNYRSHPAILKLPNEMFYDNDLLCCGDPISTHSLAKWEHLPVTNFPVLFHSIQGEDMREGNSPSWFNPQEVEMVVHYVNLLVKETRPAVRAEDIGVITPYHRQAQKIRKVLENRNLSDLKVASCEGFQGQERRVIIISTVRSGRDHVSSDMRYNLGFVAQSKRFNVAITRAKSLVIVIGCPEVLALDKENWLPFLKYCHDANSWAGEPWDPNAVESSDGEEEFVEITEDEEAPSQQAAQDCTAFISREE